MKTYTFPWQCDAAFGELEPEISKKEVSLIKKAYRDAFSYLEEVSDEEWQSQYNDLLKQADLLVNDCDHYHKGVFQQRNVWMVDRSNRVIAYYNGTAGGTRNTIKYAKKHGIEIVVATQ